MCTRDRRKLVTTAAQGYSSYGNQIGLATGQVDELYHPGYVAKRMEIGAVVGATPASHVRREEPAPGDVIILLGGRTGRDLSLIHISSAGLRCPLPLLHEERSFVMSEMSLENTGLHEECGVFGMYDSTGRTDMVSAVYSLSLIHI